MSLWGYIYIAALYLIYTMCWSMSGLRQLLTGLIPRRLRFDPRPMWVLWWVNRHSNMFVLYKEPTRCSFGSIVYYSLQNYSTCFGPFLCPSSGVLKTVVAATGACHGSGWYISSKDVQGRLPTAHSAVGKCRVILQLLINNPAKVASCWFVI